MEIKSIAEDYNHIIEKLITLDRIKTISIFSALLLNQNYQSNCIRFEVIIHVCLIYCKGTQKPTRKLIESIYEQFGEGYCGMMEDPAEDAFVSLVTTSLGDFRIFEGLWESGSFYLQRVLNVVEEIPDKIPYLEFKKSILSLLRLSEALAERTNVCRYTFGNTSIVDSLQFKSLKQFQGLERLISFTLSDLSKYGIELHTLSPFFLNLSDVDRMLFESIGHSTLERFPLLLIGNCIYVVLSSAISAAIRRYAFEFVKSIKMEKIFEARLSVEYAYYFSQIHVLGLSRLPNLKFIQLDVCWNSSLMFQFDSGRYIHLEFVMDSLFDFDGHGFLGNSSVGDLENIIDVKIQKAIEAAKENQDYKGGLTLIISCGYGRAFKIKNFDTHDASWRIEYMSAASLQILQWTKNFSLSILWRILEEREKLETLNVYINNINGLLNLVAWVMKNNWNLIPHDLMPEEAGVAGKSLNIVIDISGLRELRYNYYMMSDPHQEVSPEGERVLLYKGESSVFDEKNDRPLYVPINLFRKNRLGFVYKSAKRNWWCDVKCHDATGSRSYYQHWEMLQEWMVKAIPIVETRIKGLPFGSISLTFLYESLDNNGNNIGVKPDRNLLRNHIDESIDHDKAAILIKIDKEFMGAFGYSDNIAEKTIVHSFVSGVVALSSKEFEEKFSEDITDIIVPNQFARHIHHVYAQKFRDYVNGQLPKRKILISENDDTAIKLGLGWRAWSRGSENIILGKNNCTKFLNDLVQNMEIEICSKIRAFDRKELIVSLIANIEAIAAENDRWERTSRAVLSTYGDGKSVFIKISEKLTRLKRAALASRLLIEIAVCESPLNGGKVPGQIDLSQLMALVTAIYFYGGISNAIHKDIMESRIVITPLGDIKLNYDFIDSIMSPFVATHDSVELTNNAKEFKKYYEEASVCPSVEGLFDTDFWHAWKDEVGISIDELRMFMDAIDDWAISEKQIMLVCKRSEFVAHIINDKNLSKSTLDKIFDSFILFPRLSWKNVPEGFIESDRHLWRFRRRLSFIRRPLVQLDVCHDPVLIISPGTVRDSIIYVIRNFHKGTFPVYQAHAKAMQKWIGSINHKRGTKFNSEVANRLHELSWEAKSDIKITHLLGMSFDRDYGDIDVLAWDPATGVVLLVECKDLHFHKTISEVAEQLSDFKGEAKSNGKPDLLKKHLDRIELVKQCSVELAKFICVDCIRDIKGVLVFKNHVPMQFAQSLINKMIPIFIFDELENIV